MEITTALLTRYLHGKCTAEEVKNIESFLAKNPDTLHSLFPEEEWHATALDEPYPREDEVYLSTYAQVKPIHKVRRYIRWSIQVAAVLFVIGISTFFMFPHRDAVEHLSHTPIAPMQDTAAVGNLYYINSGNTNMIVSVHDGTIITLYPKSEVRFAETFLAQQERKIELKGKAKFEVAKDKTKPFKVYTDGIVTTALGTIFVVDEMAFAETKINLLEGSIEIMTLKNEMNPIKRIIKPNESLQINYHSNTVTEEVKINSTRKNRAGHYYQTSTQIIIKNSALLDIIQNIEQNFNIKILYDPLTIRDKYFSGIFEYKNDSYRDIIDEINYLHEINLSKKQ